MDPGPKRGEKTWDEFIRIHAQTLWQCDFFSKPVWTLKGLRDFYALTFLHVGSRKVFVSLATDHPNADWVVAQAESFCRHVETEGAHADLVFHDSDTKLCQAFDGVLKAKGLRVRRLRPLSPNLNAFVERWIQSIQHECLNHFIVLGEKHLNHLISQYVEHYHTERPHQGLDIGNELLVPMKPPDDSVPSPDKLVCHERLGGLLKSYSRKAAYGSLSSKTNLDAVGFATHKAEQTAHKRPLCAVIGRHALVFWPRLLRPNLQFSAAKLGATRAVNKNV